MKIQAWVKKANEWFRKNRLLESDDIGVHRKPVGMELYLKRSMGGGSGYTSGGGIPAKIIGNRGAFWAVDLYENGISSDPTVTNVTAYVLDLNFSNSYITGDWVIVSASAIGTTGGGNVP